MRSKTMSNETLSKKQREELLTALKVRFEKNRTAIKVLNGPKCKRGWKPILKSCGHSMKWKELAVNRTSSVRIRRRANTFFMIVQRKVRKAAEVFVTTVKRWSQGKNNKPEDNAVDMAAAIGIELLTEEQYRELQKLGNFDTKTSSWVRTPSAIRKLGGALFCDRRYDHCFRVSQRRGILLCRQGIPGSLRV